METKSLGIGDVRAVLVGVLKVTVVFETVIAVVLSVRFSTEYGETLGRSVYHGVFHSVSAFNNAGLALYTDSLVRFVGDPWVCLPITVAVIAGGLGFPVLFELRRQLLRPRQWSLHSKPTVVTTAALLVVAGSSSPRRSGPTPAPSAGWIRRTVASRASSPP